MTNVDARGRSCPEPLILTRKALIDNPEGITVVVDNVCSVENITRYAGHEGYEAAREEKDGEWTLKITRR
ncbi:MAG: sulfurtransferase TusA family protein [Eubacteriales bacterium]|nr:sulfurtransferase TusA family protein [Eubacteriales bacterium]